MVPNLAKANHVEESRSKDDNSFPRAVLTDPGPQDRSELSPEEAARHEVMERIILPENNLLPVAFLEEGSIRQKAVARIAFKTGRPWGTGWLVSKDLMLTNNHVIPNKDQAKKLRAQFNYQTDVEGNPVSEDHYDFDPDSFFITNAALDYTLLRVKPRFITLPSSSRLVSVSNDEAEVVNRSDYEAICGTLEPAWGPGPDPIPGPIPGPTPGPRPHPIPGPILFPPWPRIIRIAPGTVYGHIQLPSGVVSLKRGQHVNIVQHPAGRHKEVAVQDNEIDRIYTNFVRYFTDTEGGSSGSPVFNNFWEVVALHHAAGEWDSTNNRWVNNEGIRIDRIVADIPTRAPSGSSIPTELGI